MSKKLFKDKFIGYHTFGLEVDNITVEDNSYEYVDLGLPSGTLWATRNVGAKSDEDPGLYFAWGETQGYTAQQAHDGVRSFNEDSYTLGHIGGSVSSGHVVETLIFDKYNGEDNIKRLESQDDAATVNMGKQWHMPTSEQITELARETTSQVVTTEGSSVGMLFTGTNGNKLYIPFGGLIRYKFIEEGDSWLWASDLSPKGCDTALLLHLDSREEVSNVAMERYLGLNIRGVLNK